MDDTGLFQIDGRGEVITYLDADYPSSPIAGDLLVAETDTVIVGAWSDTPYSDGSCANSFSCDMKTISVETPPPDPCVDRTPPDAPTDLSFSTDDCNGYNANLSWIPPASGVDYYKVYECTGSDTCLPNIYIAQTGDFTPTYTRNTFDINAVTGKNIFECASG